MPSLLRNRFVEDLRIRHYAERTIEIYVYCVAAFAKFFGKSPELLGEEEIRKYQRYLVYEKKASWAFFNQTVCALRFFYTKTLEQGLAGAAHSIFEERAPTSGGVEHR